MIMEIGILVIAAALLILVLIHIPVLRQIRRTAQEVEKVLEAVRMQVVPLSRDITIITQEFRGILQSVHRQIESVEEGVSVFRDTAVRVREFEENLLPSLRKFAQSEFLLLMRLFIQALETLMSFFRRR